MYVSHWFIHSSLMDTELLPPAGNSAAVNMSVQISLHFLLSVLLDTDLEVELLDHMVIVF